VIVMLAWGKKVSSEFRLRVTASSRELGCHPDDMMACIAFESAETFRADIRNAAGSGAVGLIQFMPQTAAALGTSTDQLVRMTPEQQLSVVECYFAPRAGQLKSIEDLYMAILWPAAIGKPDDYVLFDRADAAHPKLYLQNRGLDFNANGRITKREAAAGPRAKLAKGLLPEFASP
jgi:hypothetical protein